MPDNRPEALKQPLRAGVIFLQTVAPLEGRSIRIVSGVRTREEQIALRQRHCGPSDYDIFEKPSGECSPPTARPGTSRHETGDAVDLGGDKDWAFGKLQRHGFTRPVRGEDWHFEHPLTREAPRGGSDTRHLDVIMDLAREMADATGTDVEAAAAALNAGGGGSSISLPGIPVTVPSPGKVTDVVGDGLGFITDPLAAVGALIGVLLDPGFWRRVGLGMAGAALVLMGLVMISRDSLNIIPSR